MRDYMSDPSLSESMRCYERAVHHMGAAAHVIAEREARAILAETEPWPIEICRHVPIGGSVYVFEDQIQAALAESLARFIEAEV